MQRHAFPALAALLLAAATPSSAQSLLQPATPPPANAPAQPTGIGPQLKTPQAVPMVPADIEQRAATAEPIKSTGPANETTPGFKPPPAVRAPKKPASVVDALGRPVSGAVQVAPNRVYDPGSGRYYHTVPAGERQKIVP